MNYSRARRKFLERGALGAIASWFPTSTWGVPEPFVRAGESRLRLSLAAYSFRDFFSSMKGKPQHEVPADKQIEMLDFIRYCAEHGWGGTELTSYFFDPAVTDAHLAECRHLAHTTGVEISGTAVGNNFSYPQGSPERVKQMAYVKQWIDRAVILGAPHIRVFAGVHPKGVSAEDAERNATEALEEAGDYAASKGVFLGIENHDSVITSARLLRIVKAVQSPWVGVNLDTGNFRSDDPYADIAASAPYAVNVQLKVKLMVGAKRELSDIERIARILRDAGYQGYLVLEYEEEADPYLEVPKYRDQLLAVCDS